jgi:quinoprotein glucose dehydrogenase
LRTARKEANTLQDEVTLNRQCNQPSREKSFSSLICCATMAVIAILLLNMSTVARAQKKARKPAKKPPIAQPKPIAPNKSDSEWQAYARDGAGTHYSPLSQITRANVANLKVAWSYRTGAMDVKGRSVRNAAFEATPILADGMLYLSTPFNRVIALDPITGKEKWAYDARVDLTRGYSELTSRGVSTWSDAATGKRRIYVATIDARLIALDAANGEPCRDFGQEGQVDLTRDVRLVDRGDYQVTSPPAVIGDLLIVGSSMGDNRGVELERGVVRAYNARTGKLVWSWDPIPKDAHDPARKTWQDDSAQKTGAANAWSIISVDPVRNLVFVPTGSPSPDFYGGERKGNNEYANSVVALEASTGKVVWHFQVVHHDLWDYDVASQPMLIDLKRNGRTVPAVVVGTKIGHLFVLDRATGTPLFPVEERPVPRTKVPGEQSSRTQPFPKIPVAIVPQKLTAEDAWGVTPEDREACRQIIKSARSEGLFTPPSLEGTIVFPGNAGGMNWSGMSYDPKRGLLITNTNRIATLVRLIPRDEYNKLRSTGGGSRFKGEFGSQTGTPYGLYREHLRGPSGAPCNPPPWGALTAVDLGTGELRWDVPLGTIPQLAMIPKSSEWGSINLGGSAVTAGGLVFIAAAMDTYLRAFDVETGKEVWKTELPASAHASPMTYFAGGKQYLVICAGGHGKLGTKIGDYVVAFSL